MKEQSFFEDILAAHAEQLQRGERTQADAYLAAFPDHRAELRALFALAQNVKQTLVPMQPSAAFRTGLRASLQLAGQHQVARRAFTPTAFMPRNRWWMGAAALGAGVAAGSVIAWVARRSSRSASARPAHAH